MGRYEGEDVVDWLCREAQRKASWGREMDGYVLLKAVAEIRRLRKLTKRQAAEARERK